MISDSEIERRRAKAASARGSRERRDFAATGIECRTLLDGTLRMGGWASVTNHAYQVGGFEEVNRPSAFKRTLAQNPRVNLLINHTGLPIASTPSGSLTLTEDDRGLRWDAELDPEDGESVALARKVSRGLVTDCSFAFLCTDDEWSRDMSHRTIKSVELNKGDISIVTVGANDAASVALRGQQSTSRPLVSVDTLNRRDQEQLALMRHGIHPKPRTRPPSSRYDDERARIDALRRA